MGWKEDIDENFKFGVISMLILKMLTCGDMYGYEIRKQIQELSDHVITIKEGTLYTPIYRMEKQGLISSKKEIVGGKRFRMYYHIEDEGRKRLEYMLSRYKTIYDTTTKVLNHYEKSSN